MNIRYIDTNNPIVRIYYVDDLVKYNLVDYSIINHTKKYYLSGNGIFNGISLNTPDFLKYDNINLIHQATIGPDYTSECQSPELDLINRVIIIELDILKNNMESKYDKKINDLFEKTSEKIKKLKKDLDIKNDKIRDLELKVHFIESQIDKKVKIDYNYIKQKNKALNTEFKRVAKLMKLG